MTRCDLNVKKKKNSFQGKLGYFIVSSPRHFDPETFIIELLIGRYAYWTKCGLNQANFKRVLRLVVAFLPRNGYCDPHIHEITKDISCFCIYCFYKSKNVSYSCIFLPY